MCISHQQTVNAAPVLQRISPSPQRSRTSLAAIIDPRADGLYRRLPARATPACPSIPCAGSRAPPALHDPRYLETYAWVDERLLALDAMQKRMAAEGEDGLAEEDDNAAVPEWI
jgi:hypothetical protein